MSGEDKPNIESDQIKETSFLTTIPLVVLIKYRTKFLSSTLLDGKFYTGLKDEENKKIYRYDVHVKIYNRLGYGSSSLRGVVYYVF